jgi:glycosyltransferase involved in cell wall biosynthesis
MNSSAEARGRSSGTIAISANTSWNLINFRSRLIRDLIGAGYRVVAIAPADDHSAALEALGAEFEPITIRSSGTSPVEDLRLILAYRKILARIRPAAFLGVTIKPNIYGSIAAQTVGARIINNVSGLGPLFIEQGLLTKVVTGLYRFALRKSATVFFQNREDMGLFLDRRIVRESQVALLPGSGVDLSRFVPGAADSRSGAPFRFLFTGRLQWTKGIAEFVEAARIVRRTHPETLFQVLGAAGDNEMKAVPATDIAQWQAEGLIDYLGATDDVRPFIGAADCVVLPSYREGLPRALLEGSAMGKPLIGTDVPGCRDVVADGVTGLLCEVRSGGSLAAAMIGMLGRSSAERREMGRLGRLKVEQEFCETVVVGKYLDALAAPPHQP